MDSSIILVFLLTAGEAFSQEVCTKTVINSCGDCIRSGPFCVWCKELNFTKPGEPDAARCNTKEQLMVKGCMEAEIISPQSTLTKVKDTPLTTGKFSRKEPTQLQPQEIKLNLRPGQPKTFEVSFKRVEGYPVDLYYLMDLSYSMKDDLRNIQGLGQDLFQTLSEITNDARIGFGSFVDKTALPFTNTNMDKLRKPCPDKEQQCQAAFGYKHVLSMTADRTEFKAEVSKQFISGNLDSPEGSLDAVMQAAVCGDNVGWRNSSTRLMVVATDAGFHMAGDGKLAGILEPNDEQCHMTNNVYDKGLSMDYPSVGQVALQLEKNNIQPIFAVTQDVAPVYRKLSELIPKSEVGVLSSDSSNVVGLIQNAYKKLSSQVTLTNGHLPDNVRVTYTPRCPNKGPAGDIKGVCNDVAEGQRIDFDVTVTVDKCIEETSFLIGPLGIKDKLKVTLSTRCECECDDPKGDHSHCSGKGRVSCGMCSCNPGFLGQTCDCAVGTGDENSLRAACRRDNGTECEGRGDCVCGHCYCHAIKGGGNYRGAHCECDDFHCEPFQNKMCGGKGKCDCGTCICDHGYEGSACQCEKSEEQCRSPTGSVCSGRGTCTCNRCSCIEGYRGLYCEESYGGTSPCQTKQKCIECRGFGTGPFSKNCSSACKSIFSHEMVESLPAKSCKLKDTEGCWMLFELKQLDGMDNYTAQIQITRECPELPNIYAIIGGSIAGVALIGILILLLVKALIYVNDLKEFRKFENERKKSKWAQADNPLFKTATTTTANPIFTGE